MKSDWIEFNIYPEIKGNNLKAKYCVINGEYRIKLGFTAPKGQYYSFLNDASEMAKELLTKNKKI